MPDCAIEPPSVMGGASLPPSICSPLQDATTRLVGAAVGSNFAALEGAGTRKRRGAHPAAPPPAAPPPTETSMGSADTSGTNPKRIAAYGAFGLGAVGLAVGTVFLVKAGSTQSEADDLCPSEPCSASSKSAIDAKDSDAASQRAASAGTGTCGGSTSAGNAGSAGARAVCAMVIEEYAAELAKHLGCRPNAASQCADRVAAAPGCECLVFIEPTDPFAIEHLKNLEDGWFSDDCSTPTCPATCSTASVGACQADSNFPSGGRCVTP